MSRLPVPVDLDSVLDRLNREEQVWVRRLAEIEELLRKFVDIERPAYEEWLRLELGPKFMEVEELYEQIRERRIFVQRITELIETRGLAPREALYVVLEGKPEKAEKAETSGGWDADEIEARRQAKREAKRSERRQAKKEAKSQANKEVESPSAPKGRRAVTSLFRDLARKLHPDSPTMASSIPADRLRSLWLEVQKAYQSSDLGALLAIAAWIEKRGGGALSVESLSLSERFERVRSLIRSFSRMEKKLAEMATHAAWGFERARGSQRKKLRSAAARQIEEDLGEAQELLAALEDFIESIGPPRRPR